MLSLFPLVLLYYAQKGSYVCVDVVIVVCCNDVCVTVVLPCFGVLLVDGVC